MARPIRRAKWHARKRFLRQLTLRKNTWNGLRTEGELVKAEQAQRRSDRWRRNG